MEISANHDVGNTNNVSQNTKEQVKRSSKKKRNKLSNHVKGAPSSSPSSTVMDQKVNDVTEHLHNGLHITASMTNGTANGTDPNHSPTTNDQVKIQVNGEITNNAHVTDCSCNVEIKNTKLNDKSITEPNIISEPCAINEPDKRCSEITNVPETETKTETEESRRSTNDQSILNEPETEGAVAITDLSEPSAGDLVVEKPVQSSDITYKEYESELQMPDIIRLIQKDLSEPYSIYTYRYFIHNWPRLCFLAMHNDLCVGAIVCKLDMHRPNLKRGYIAMLAVDKAYRKLKIGTNLVQKAIQVST